MFAVSAESGTRSAGCAEVPARKLLLLVRYEKGGTRPVAHQPEVFGGNGMTEDARVLAGLVASASGL